MYSKPGEISMAVVFGGPGTPTTPGIEKEEILSLMYVLLEKKVIFLEDKKEIKSRYFISCTFMHPEETGPLFLCSHFLLAHFWSRFKEVRVLTWN